MNITILRLCHRQIQIFLLITIISTHGQMKNITNDSASVIPEVHFSMMNSINLSNSDMSTESSIVMKDVNDIISKSNNFNDNAILKEQTTNSSTTDTSVYITPNRNIIVSQATIFENDSTIPITTTTMIFTSKESNAINVTYRTSSMFTGHVTYNCSTMNISDLIIYTNTPANCSVLECSSNNEINIKCHSIENKAGRDFEFILGMHENNQSIINKTFIVTLKPLLLNTSANINITVHENLTSASILVSNCEEIAEPDKLTFKCDSSNQSSESSLINCTHTCVDLQPGCVYEASLILSPIKISDKENDTFPNDTKTETYRIDLDKITNLTLDGNVTQDGTALICFNPPRGYYDELRFNCYAKDQNCPESNQNLTNKITNCSNCSFVWISQVIQGVEYECQAWTMKANFSDATSDPLLFNTISNCEKIAEPDKLTFKCDSSNQSSESSLINCTHTCVDLQPGSVYEASLILSPIKISDKENDTFPNDTKTEIYRIDLDKITNLTLDGNVTQNGTALIHFNPPHGYYDELRFNCYAQDQNCFESNQNLTDKITNCSNCSSVWISQVIQGVEYECQAWTMKANFSDATSDPLLFNTSLTPVLYGGQNFFNTSRISFPVTPQSDYDNIRINCIAVGHRSPSCSDVISQHNSCSTTLQLNGTRGCDYQCSFITQKMHYNDATSTPVNISLCDYFINLIKKNECIVYLGPPTPIIEEYRNASRSIYIKWKIDETSYIQSFDLFKNNIAIENANDAIVSVSDTIFSYNYTDDIKPFQTYELYVRLNSNYNVPSKSIVVTTSPEAPKKPTDNDVKNKIILQEMHEASTSNQYVINIDLSLFSDEYGIVKKYLIYVRQDQNNNMPEIILNGTYAEALNNALIDYLAAEILISSSAKNLINKNGNITVLLGNETICLNESVKSTPCNGPLKPSTNYKVIVGGCTIAGCTHVLSQQFKTQNLPTPPNNPGSSKAWVVIFPLLAVAVVAGLAVWKRKLLKQMFDRKIKPDRKYSKDSRSSSISLSSIYVPPRKRPKPLSKYVNMTDEDKKAIYAEYQELDSTSPQYRPSEDDSEYAIYNRYSNIPARGPWERTAVQLNGLHRFHDYINANEIKGLSSEKQYIACQGPLETTCEDFWDMIIQYGVKKIVMLTRTEERNPHNHSQTLSKCYRYFPDKKGKLLTFNRVSVQVIDVEYQENVDLEIRRILIKADNNEHHVFHYYFTGWPDFSVVEPRKLLDLIQYINNHGKNQLISVEQSKKTSLSPTVIHCSAGVGRTGTYIAVDIIMRLIDRSQQDLLTMQLDVMGVVYQLRQDRGKMVQTKDQYMLVNRCVEEYLRETNRLNDILQQSSLYGNVNMNSTQPNNNVITESPSNYVNINKPSPSEAGANSSRSSPVIQSKY
ncbi:unnamed protein product [Rotaria sordida]|uniref:Protein-tyrosine-phosphatase n=1 Tax=Rotaria sordida TaxID=392033 RepID=A0A814PRE8_9BILA|nr:unnamed protein product [Rotaria sordida]